MQNPVSKDPGIDDESVDPKADPQSPPRGSPEAPAQQKGQAKQAPEEDSGPRQLPDWEDALG